MPYSPEVHNDHIWAVIGSPWSWLLLWIAAINLVTFFFFGLDKWRAKRKAAKPEIRRIPERTLFLCAILGGSLGAWLGMQVFHHKTLHKSFRYGIPAILTIQVVVLFVLLFRHQFM